MDTSAMDTSAFDDTAHVIQLLTEPAGKNKTLWHYLIDGTVLSEMIEEIAFQQIQVPPGTLPVNVNVERMLARFIFKDRYGPERQDIPLRNITPKVRSLIRNLYPILLSVFGSSKNDQYISILQKARAVQSPSISDLLEEINAHMPSPSGPTGINPGERHSTISTFGTSPEQGFNKVQPLQIGNDYLMEEEQRLLDAQLTPQSAWDFTSAQGARRDASNSMETQMSSRIHDSQMADVGEDSGIGGIQGSPPASAADVTSDSFIQESDIEAIRKTLPFTPNNTEPAELPRISDTYSDSNISMGYPEWAKSPDLRGKLLEQELRGRHFPKTIFGPVPKQTYYGSASSSSAFSQRSSPTPAPSMRRAVNNDTVADSHNERQSQEPTPITTQDSSDRVGIPKTDLGKSKIRTSLSRSCKKRANFNSSSTQTFNLSGTGFAVQPKRRPKPKSPKKVSSRVLAAGCGSIKMRDKVTLSYQIFFPIIVPFLEYRPQVRVVEYSRFNPYRANANKGSILSDGKKNAIEKLVHAIMEKLPGQIDDDQLGKTLDGGFGLDKLVSKPGQTVMDVRQKISLEKKRNKDIRNLLDFMDLSLIRVHQSLSDRAEFRKTQREYDSDIMNVYLCIWGWLCRLGPAFNGRQLSLVMYLCAHSPSTVRRDIGIDRLKKCLSPNQRQIAFHMLLMRLSNLSFTDSSKASHAPYMTALDFMKKLLRGSKGPNGVTITEAIISDALTWVSDLERSTGNPTGLSHMQIQSTDPLPYLQSLLSEGGSANQPQKRHRDEGVLSSTGRDEGSPAKRTRLQEKTDSGFYEQSSGGSPNTRGKDQVKRALSQEVESLAKYMEDTQSRIEAAATIAFPSTCGPESIRNLKPDTPFDPPLVDAIVSLAKPANSYGPSPVYLGAQCYAEIMKDGFGTSKSRVSHIPRKGSWLMSAWKNGHWRGISIEWDGEKIGVYDSQGFRAKDHRDEIASKIKLWIEHLSDGNACRVFDVTRRFGPQQDKGDTPSCGVLTTLTICRWLHDREVDVQVGDPLKLRKEYVVQISRSLGIRSAFAW